MKRPNLWEHDPRQIVSLTVEDLIKFSDFLIAKAETQWKDKQKLRIYTNAQVCEMLGINKQTLAKYRASGKIGFSKLNDKFWYSQNDIDQFLNNCYYPPFR